MLVGQTLGNPAKGEIYIEGELGSGAMGTVYRATLTAKGKKLPVALKVVSLGLVGNESAMARFDRESAILQQLRHPHIVRLYGTGRFRGTPYIAMEFVDGEPLDRALARRGRLGWEEVFAYAKQLCEALQHAHDKGIIHRDLKPSNLMITTSGVLKLTDFGIAKDTDVTALTAANSTIGTAAYMSPEQCRGSRELSAKSDLYSLGVVMFELITGKKPFYAENTMDMFLKHVNEKPVRAGKLLPDLPVWVDNLIMHLLEKSPETRPYDATTVKRMIEEIEQKVQSLQSAGLDVATSRRVDRKGGDSGPVTNADREAARTIKGKGKKKKKKAKPLFEQAWVKAVGLGVILAGLVGAGVWLMWPKSPQAAFEQVKAASEGSKLDAVKAFLGEHGHKPDPVVEEARKLFRDLRTKQGEKQLDARYGSDEAGKLNRRKAEPPETQEMMDTIWGAMRAERDGRPKDAVAGWNAARAAIPDADPTKYGDDDAVRLPVYRWVAEKRLADLDAAGKKLKETKDRVEDAAAREEPPAADPNSQEGRAARAMRLEQFGDPAKAHKVWDSLAQSTATDPDKFHWFLFAAERRAATRPDKEVDPGKRLATVEKAVKAANDLWATVKDDKKDLLGPRKVRNACRDVIELYDDEQDEAVKKAVAAANTLFQEAKTR